MVCHFLRCWASQDNKQEVRWAGRQGNMSVTKNKHWYCFIFVCSIPYMSKRVKESQGAGEIAQGLIAFARPRFSPQHPQCGSQSTIIPGDWTPSSALHGFFCTHEVHINTQVHTHTHANR